MTYSPETKHFDVRNFYIPTSLSESRTKDRDLDIDTNRRH